MDQCEINRLFVITNNTHYQIIKNYIDNHPAGNNYLILTITPFENSNEFIKEIFADKTFIYLGSFINNQKHKFPRNYLDLIKTCIKVKNLKLEKYNFQQVIFSNYNSLLQHIILTESKILDPVLISDGVAIYKYAELRKKSSVAPLKGNKIFRSKILKIKPFEKILFYSPVDLSLAKHDKIEIFKYGRNLNFKIDEDKIYFVDSPLVERNFIRSENKIQYLQALKNKFPNKEFVYFAHRRESEENLKKYAFFGEVRRDNIPFEERLKFDENLPGMVISFISSVLITLPSVYPDIKFYYLPLDKEDIIDDNFEIQYFKLLNDFKLLNKINLKEINL